MSQMSPTEGIRSVTDLERNTSDIPSHLQAGNLAKLLAPAELDIENGRTRSVREFLEGFKRDYFS
ncbi:MAG: hypothetical protein Q8K68_06680 [Nitrospirota bacterium]|nr:hypothetical protein [Nitrospirota bacterium]